MAWTALLGAVPPLVNLATSYFNKPKKTRPPELDYLAKLRASTQAQIGTNQMAQGAIQLSNATIGRQANLNNQAVMSQAERTGDIGSIVSAGIKSQGALSSALTPAIIIATNQQTAFNAEKLSELNEIDAMTMQALAQQQLAQKQEREAYRQNIIGRLGELTGAGASIAANMVSQKKQETATNALLNAQGYTPEQKTTAQNLLQSGVSPEQAIGTINQDIEKRQGATYSELSQTIAAGKPMLDNLGELVQNNTITTQQANSLLNQQAQMGQISKEDARYQASQQNLVAEIPRQYWEFDANGNLSAALTVEAYQPILRQNAYVANGGEGKMPEAFNNLSPEQIARSTQLISQAPSEPYLNMLSLDTTSNDAVSQGQKLIDEQLELVKSVNNPATKAALLSQVDDMKKTQNQNINYAQEQRRMAQSAQQHAQDRADSLKDRAIQLAILQGKSDDKAVKETNKNLNNINELAVSVDAKMSPTSTFKLEDFVNQTINNYFIHKEQSDADSGWWDRFDKSFDELSNYYANTPDFISSGDNSTATREAYDREFAYKQVAAIKRQLKDLLTSGDNGIIKIK